MKAYLFDIDGTLANGEHRLHHILKQPKDWDAFFSLCHLDEPISHIVQLCKDLHASGAAIVYVSGRSDVAKQKTMEWIKRHDLPVAPLFMRKTGDHTNDDILKIRMLQEVVASGFEPIMVFDDRNRVVQAWRAHGIPCAQVAPGDF